ncbi:Rab family GTPase [Spartinivicinus ruber]|uniref:Rab family GTPase n=1 Tax=Spartinivicinus ruber TaxID=2683272 RepID=UPI0013D0D70A|nr:Rab family GTPase [Spartinivicinus ruber]
MLSKKICMLGAFAVGKTSLVKQYVHSIFNEKYHTTIGVKIDKRLVSINDQPIQLILWDIEGVDIFTELNPSYLRGASGYILVIDGTRPQTLETAREIMGQLQLNLNERKLILLINKSDLKNKWLINDSQLSELMIKEEDIFITSAKTGQRVEQAFQHIAELIAPITCYQADQHEYTSNR